MKIVIIFLDQFNLISNFYNLYNKLLNYIIKVTYYNLEVKTSQNYTL